MAGIDTDESQNILYSSDVKSLKAIGSCQIIIIIIIMNIITDLQSFHMLHVHNNSGMLHTQQLKRKS